MRRKTFEKNLLDGGFFTWLPSHIGDNTWPFSWYSLRTKQMVVLEVLKYLMPSSLKGYIIIKSIPYCTRKQFSKGRDGASSFSHIHIPSGHHHFVAEAGQI